MALLENRALAVAFGGFWPGKWTFAQGQAPPIQQKNAGFGDAMVGLRGGYTGGAFAGSLGTSVTLPLYNNDPEVLNMGTGNSDFYDDIVPLGQGTIDVHIDLALGVSLHPVPMWLALNSGVRVRNRQYATVLPGAFQVGYKPVEEVALMLNTEWSAALKNGEQPKFYFDEYGKGPTIIDGQSSVKLGLAGMVDVWKTLAVEASVSAPVVGQRTAAGIGVGVGVSYRN